LDVLFYIAMTLELYLKQKVCENGTILNIASFFLLIVAGLSIFIAGLGLAVFFLPCVALGIGAVALISPVVGSYVTFKYLLKKIAQTTCWDQKQRWSLCHVRSYAHRYIMHSTIMKSVFSSIVLVAFSALYFLMFSIYFVAKSCIDTMRYLLEGFMAPFTVCFSLCLRGKPKASVHSVEHDSGSVGPEEQAILLAPSSVLDTSSKAGKKRGCKHHNVIAMEGVINKASSKRRVKPRSLKGSKVSSQ
jgi:hypothetical protein